MTETEFKTPLPIADEDYVYRQVHYSQLYAASKKKKFPTAAHFKPDSDGLSVHVQSLTVLNHVYHILGLSYKPNTEQYKDYKAFKIFSLPVAFLKSIENIKGVNHTPHFSGNPASVGKPNVYAHASVLYGEDDEDIRLKLSTYCDGNYESSYQKIPDFISIDNEIQELRARLNDTPYHRLDNE